MEVFATTGAHCGNYENLLSHLVGQKVAKTKVLPMKLLNIAIVDLTKVLH